MIPFTPDGPTDAREAAPEARPTTHLTIPDGATVELPIAPVRKRLGGADVSMLAYGGSIPGPTLRVAQGTEVAVEAVNHTDLDTTIHWHGLRLDNRFDGTTATQEPMRRGDRFAYRLAFPDAGLFWYHPHVREDVGQEMGLAGTVLVAPRDPAHWAPAHREVVLVLDDVLLEGGAVAPFSPDHATHAAMGRFGNVLLVNGEAAPTAGPTLRRGEVVRFFITDTANTRVFDLAMPGARMKLVGGDAGRYEREELVDGVIVAPSERVVVDVLFDAPGRVALQHRSPHRTEVLATFLVEDEAAVPDLAPAFALLRTSAEMAGAREALAEDLTAAPAKTLALVAEMDLPAPELPPGSTPLHSCPMHPEVVAHAPGRCPLCGMKLLPGAAGAHHDHGAAATSHAHHAAADPRHAGIEWEDDMIEVNRASTSANTRWRLVDRDTGAAGPAIAWRFRVGDRVKIRLVNEMDSDHPMHHPFHIHGAGRFVVTARDGVLERNLVWKDTVLVRRGETVDIVLEVTHPGRWMAHCHIAEHHESGMMLMFDVDPADDPSPVTIGASAPRPGREVDEA